MKKGIRFCDLLYGKISLLQRPFGKQEANEDFEKYDIYGYIIKYLKPCIQWETIVLCRILMIILPVGQSESALLR